MSGASLTGRARSKLQGPPKWLAVPFRPASAGPVRDWQDRSRRAVKAALAAVAAWTLAKYVAGQADPYFAPLAALLGVYPTVARSLREGFQYVGGFLLGAALAVPVGMLLGPGVAGIAVVVVGGVLLGGWRRLGDQSAQVTFTALFALLLGGHQPTSYVTHRLIEVGIGVATGLAVNIAVFPPLQLRPAEHAIRRWAEDIACTLEVLADAAGDPDATARSWPQLDRKLTQAADHARGAVRGARESLRWNPRAMVHQAVPRPDSAVLDSLEELTAQTRAIAWSLLNYPAVGRPGGIAASFAANYGRMLHLLAPAVRQLADMRGRRPPQGEERTEAADCQRSLENQAAQLPDYSQERGTAKHLTCLAAEMIIGAGLDSDR
jgi:uncharacterized membrane protein YccC